MDTKIFATKDVTGTCPQCRHVRGDKRRVVYANGDVHVHRWCDGCRILFGKQISKRSIKNLDQLPVVEPWKADTVQERLF